MAEIPITIYEAAARAAGYVKNSAGLWEDPKVGEDGVSDVRALCEMEGIALPPASFTYERWRHGGWYVSEVRYLTGARGCVSNNYEDKKWRIACDPRPFEDQPTFRTRDEAARAEWLMVEGMKDAARAAGVELYQALYNMKRAFGDQRHADSFKRNICEQMDRALALAEGKING